MNAAEVANSLKTSALRTVDVNCANVPITATKRPSWPIPAPARPHRGPHAQGSGVQISRNRACFVLAVLITAICFGCQEGPTGPSAAELEAQKQAAAEKQRAEAERARREMEETLRHQSEAAAERYSMAAVIGWSMVALFVGLVAGMALGLRTRRDYQTQSQRGGNQTSPQIGPGDSHRDR